MSETQNIVKGISLMIFAEVVSRTISFFLIIILARYLGDIGLGKYSFVFAFVGVFSIISDFGISAVMTKEVARDRKLTQKYVANTLAFKSLLAVMTIILSASIMFLSDKSFDIKIGVLLAGISQAFYYMVYPFRIVFNTHEKQSYHSVYLIMERVIAFSLGLFLLMKGFGLTVFVSVLVLSFGIGSVLAAPKIALRHGVRIGARDIERVEGVGDHGAEADRVVVRAGVETDSVRDA